MIHNKLLSSNLDTRDPYFNNTMLLLKGDGSNGAQNNTFVDSSSNSTTITRVGNTTQGSFNPFSYWGFSSASFNSATSSIYTTGGNLAITTGPFTIEGWINPSSYATGYIVHNLGWYAGRNIGWVVSLSASGYIGLSASNGTFNALFSVLTATNSVPLSTWSHFAFVRDSNNIITCYINGIPSGSVLYSASLDLSYAWSYTYYSGVGTYYADNVWQSSGLIGKISNIRISKTTAFYTGAFTPSSPLNAISGTSFLACRTFITKDNSISNYTLTINGSVTQTLTGPWSQKSIDIKQYDPSVVGGSAYFDGIGDGLTGASSDKFLLRTGDFTIDAWVYPTSTSVYRTIFTNRGTSATSLWFGFNTGTMALVAFTTSAVLTSSILCPLNAWSHVALSRTNGIMKIFVNGVEGASTTTTYDFSTGNACSIGHDAIGSSSYFVGYISNLRVIKGTSLYSSTFEVPRSLSSNTSDTSLLCNFASASVYDHSMQSDFETIGNAQISTSIKKYGTGSMYFDGTGDYLYSPATENLAFGTGDFTIETWMYVSSFAADMTIFDMRPATTNGTYPTMYTTASTLRYYASTADRIVSSTLTAGTWYHIALSRSSSTTRMFINGTLVGSWADTTNYLCSRLYIGTSAYTVGAANFNGYMDDFRITKDYARYTSAFTPPTSTLPIY